MKSLIEIQELFDEQGRRKLANWVLGLRQSRLTTIQEKKATEILNKFITSTSSPKKEEKKSLFSFDNTEDAMKRLNEMLYGEKEKEKVIKPLILDFEHRKVEISGKLRFLSFPILATGNLKTIANIIPGAKRVFNYYITFDANCLFLRKEFFSDDWQKDIMPRLNWATISKVLRKHHLGFGSDKYCFVGGYRIYLVMPVKQGFSSNPVKEWEICTKPV